MAIIQISKIQQRSGDLVDLPQLDNAEFGFASDENKLFIGKTVGDVENIEVLTSYSNIAFDQIQNSGGNLDVDTLTLANGQVMTYDGNNWVNRGGEAGGLITLGDASNIKIDGGAIGYVLETDGTGNLSWTPKSAITAYVLDATQANPGVIYTTEDNFFVNKAQVTITDVPGMTELNANTFYIKVLTANSFSLYQDSSLATPVDTTGYGEFPFTTATASDATTDQITVGDNTLFNVNDPVIFIGNLDTGNSGITANQTYYVLSLPGSDMKISETIGGTAVDLGTATFTANVYVPGGRVISAVGSTANAAAGGVTNSVQYNSSGVIVGDSNFLYNPSGSGNVSITGNANVGNLNSIGNVTSTRLISNIANGTAPLTVTSITKVANLNVEFLDDYNASITAAASTYANGVSTRETVVVRDSNGNIEANTFNGNSAAYSTMSVTGTLTAGNVYANSGTIGASLLTGTLTTNAQPNITSVGTLTSLAVTGNGTFGNVYANVGTVGAFLLTGTLTTSAQPNITSVGTLTSLSVTGNILAGNVYANSGTIGAALLTGTLTTAAQPNITSVGILTSLTVSGNITAGNISGIFANGTSNVRIPAANGNVNISAAGNANILVVTGTGVNVAGTFNSTGNANVGNLGTAGLITATGNVSGGNLTTTGALSVTGNANVGNIGATAGVFTGNVTAGNVYANTGTVGASLLTGTLTTAAQPNITSVGNLTSLTVVGNTTTGGIKTDNYYYANGNPISFAGTYSNSNVAAYLPTFNGQVGGGTATFAGTTITTGANTTLGSITGNWILTAGSRMQATYADLAEYYAADKAYIPGTVLEFGGDEEVTIAGIESNKLAGVVSSEPAYVMNGGINAEHPTIIALIGRVPVRVIGHVSKGDMLVSAGNGLAKSSILTPKIGTVIGKAISNKWNDGEGVVEVMVGRM